MGETAGRRQEFALQIERLQGVQEPMLHREEGRRGTSRRPRLGIDPFDVGPGRLRCNVECARDLAVGGSASNQDQHLDLSRRKSSRSSSALALALSYDLKLDD